MADQNTTLRYLGKWKRRKQIAEDNIKYYEDMLVRRKLATKEEHKRARAMKKNLQSN